MDTRQKLNWAKALINLACAAHTAGEADVCEATMQKLKQHLATPAEPPSGPEAGGGGPTGVN